MNLFTVILKVPVEAGIINKQTLRSAYLRGAFVSERPDGKPMGQLPELSQENIIYLRRQVISIMMEKLRNPKNVKTISLIVAAIFVIGCFTLAMSAGGFGSGVASAAASESAVGVVNYQVLVSQSPKLEQVRSEMEKAIAETRREFDSKSQDLNDDDKERYYKQLQERLGNKEKDLMDPLLNEINEVIKKIADKKGLKVVVDKSTVVYGGTDITDEVAKALQNPKK